MLSKVYAGTVLGVDGVFIEVEVDVATNGFPTFTIVGLPDKAIDEAKDRVRTAVTNASLQMPESRITVNLAPADIPKNGAGFDLPITIGILASAGIIPQESLVASMFIGELSLNGALRAIPGVISITMMAKEKGIKSLFLPADNAQEATHIKGVAIYPIHHVSELIAHLNGGQRIAQARSEKRTSTRASYESDFQDIKGQNQAKRALTIAAAGFHNIHLMGVPGAGKTMLCRTFPTILPELEEDEVVEVARIYSSTGSFQPSTFTTQRPFRAPHHTTSRNGLIGGGAHPIPGEISLAHRGVLFLDEFPEFPRSVLEALRQPLEDGIVTISRAAGSICFPCEFLLLAASNPCPCGYYGHPKKPCTCLPGRVTAYKKRLSGPLLDRIDLHIQVLPVDENDLYSNRATVSSQELRHQVQEAFERQKKRLRTVHKYTNSSLTTKDIKNTCTFTSEADLLLKQAISRLQLSARSYFKVIKVAQTIADLEHEPTVQAAFIAEALQYRENKV